MRVTLLFNPVAGRGRAVSAARTLAERLDAAGHASRLTPTVADPRPGWLAEPLAESDLLVVLGGDGAVRMAASEMLGGAVPIYHFPLGTENLFAREFGARADPLQLLASIERDQRRSIDVARVADDDFLLMLSVGFDAAVVADLSARRSGPIRHASYLAPVLRQLVRWQPPLLTIEADGVRIVDRRRGFAVVANSAQYAVRINPAPRASMSDGALDVVFFPCASRLSVPGWMLRCRLGRQANSGRMISHRAAAVQIVCDPAHPIQIDGDLPAEPSPRERVDISLRPRSLPVLLAAQ